MRSKYRYTLILIAILIGISAFLLFRYYTKTYSVTFDTKGGTIYATQEVKPGEIAEVPEDPVMEGYIFLGWYVNDEMYDPDTIINSDLTVIARWDKIEGTVVS